MVWGFTDQETYDLYMDDDHVQKRELVLKVYNQKNNIECLDSVVEMTDEEPIENLEKIRLMTFLPRCFILNVIPTTEPDRPVINMKRPKKDTMIIDP